MTKKYNPDTLYAPIGAYTNAIEVGPDETLVVSAGIIGATREGVLIEDPTKQIESAWKNVAAWLEGVGATRGNLVKLTIYLSSPDYVVCCRETRERVLGDPIGCAATGVIAQLFDPAMVIEIDILVAKWGTMHAEDQGYDRYLRTRTTPTRSLHRWRPNFRGYSSRLKSVS